jgi:hypothetical protein
MGMGMGMGNEATKPEIQNGKDIISIVAGIAVV